MRRAIIIVCDSLGVGEQPDAHEFGDEGSNTLGHVIRDGAPHLPRLERLGLLATLPDGEAGPEVTAAWGRMEEKSAGKDTITGHWEMMGVVTTDPFRTYPNGFPTEVIGEFERRIGRKTLGNIPASGTVIIDELGAEHIRSGFPIVYTSGDSVFQIAAHEDVVPPEQLYEFCAAARDLMTGEHLVGRIIARPFVGAGPGAFTRTANRRDLSVRPPSPTYLDRIRDAGVTTVGVGKISDIFDGVGIDREIRSESNEDGMAITRELMTGDDGLIFTNLVDFDSKYGHRNDPEGYARALERFDEAIGRLVDQAEPETLIFVTADHGCDPSDVSTDHTREYVPLLVLGRFIVSPVGLGTRPTFADLGATVGQYLGADIEGLPGESFLDLLPVGEIG